MILIWLGHISQIQSRRSIPRQKIHSDNVMIKIWDDEGSDVEENELLSGCIS